MNTDQTQIKMKTVDELRALVENHELGDQLLLDMLRWQGVPCDTIAEGIERLAKRQPRQMVQLGNVAIARLDNGQLWMTHRQGEGAVIQEEKLAKLLEEFFWKEF